MLYRNKNEDLLSQSIGILLSWAYQTHLSNWFEGFLIDEILVHSIRKRSFYDVKKLFMTLPKK